VSNEEEFRLLITRLEEQLSAMKPNLAAIAEYMKKVGTPGLSGLKISCIVLQFCIIFSVRDITVCMMKISLL
jgi:hypothetical protein